MRVVANPEVGDLVRERGGRLFVWTDRRRCCGGGITFLRAGTEPARGHEFGRVDVEGFDLFVDVGPSGGPDQIGLDVKGWRTKRVEAYWDGCVYAP